MDPSAFNSNRLEMPFPRWSRSMFLRRFSRRINETTKRNAGSREVTLGGKSLVEWLRDCPKDKFPGHGSIDYYLRFLGIAEYLNNNVHPQVQSLAMIHDGGYLTDHGPEHIK